MQHSILRRVSAPMLFAGGLAAASMSGVALGNDWQFSGTLYMWGAGMEVETVSGAKVDMDFDQILDNLDMTFMGALEARKDNWSLVADVVYMKLGDDKAASVPVGPLGREVDVDADVQMKSWIINLFGAYTVWRTPQASLDVLMGARYLDVEVDFDLGVDRPLFATDRKISQSGDSWDAIVGLKGRIDLDDRWYVPYYVDVGAGNSDLTWQAFGGVGYRFGWGELSLVYRHIDWDTGLDRGVSNLTVSGPTLSATFHF